MVGTMTSEAKIGTLRRGWPKKEAGKTEILGPEKKATLIIHFSRSIISITSSKRETFLTPNLLYVYTTFRHHRLSRLGQASISTILRPFSPLSKATCSSPANRHYGYWKINKIVIVYLIHKSIIVKWLPFRRQNYPQFYFLPCYLALHHFPGYRKRYKTTTKKKTPTRGYKYEIFLPRRSGCLQPTPPTGLKVIVNLFRRLIKTELSMKYSGKIFASR